MGVGDGAVVLPLPDPLPFDAGAQSAAQCRLPDLPGEVGLGPSAFDAGVGKRVADQVVHGAIPSSWVIGSVLRVVRDYNETTRNSFPISDC